jgi:Family of unknown function (DUF5677)
MADKVPVMKRIWQRDYLPNHLWALGHLAVDADTGFRLLNVALSEIRLVLTGLGFEVLVTGTLSSFEDVPAEARPAVIAALQASGNYERYFPKEWAQAIALYDDAPGKWTAGPYIDAGVLPAEAAGRSWFGAAIKAGSHGQSLASTRAKMVVVAGLLAAGKLLNFPLELGEIGIRYPAITEEERQHFEPRMRAMFLACGGLCSDEEALAIISWATRFWRANWTLSRCEPLDADIDDVKSDLSTSDDNDLSVQRTRLFNYFSERVDDIEKRFYALSNRDPDLYDPDRYEVLTGLSARAIRQAHAAVRTPLLWTPDFGSWLLRSSVEAKIVMTWLEHTGGDVYASFKDYGRGKLKLLKLHIEDFVDEQGDETDSAVKHYLEALTAEVNQDIWEEWQEISIDKTFSGVNARAMAVTVGLKIDYDLAFAPASGSAHGDWVALDREALTRCMNPLHRWHRINRTSMRRVITPELLDQTLNFVDDIVDVYERAISGQT